MTHDELKTKLSFLFDGETVASLTMYFVVSTEAGLSVKKVETTDAVREALFEQFKNSIDEKLYSNDELNIANISQVDEKLNAVYYYDLDEEVPDLKVLKDIITEPPAEEFDFDTDNLTDVLAIILVLGNESKKVAIYKRQNPMKILRRRTAISRVIRLVPSDSTLTELPTDVIEIGSSFDFLQCEDDLLIINLPNLERYFGFAEVIASIAAETVRLISNLNFIADPGYIENFINDKALAKKLMRLRRDSPVFGLKFNSVKTFIKGHSKLKDMFKFNKDESRIELNSKAAVTRFIKLLDDDYLLSQLTNIDYDAERKEVLIVDEN